MKLSKSKAKVMMVAKKEKMHILIDGRELEAIQYLCIIIKLNAKSNVEIK